MLKVSLFHPFSAKSIGLKEIDFYFSHSKPQEKVLLKTQGCRYKVSIDYFTGAIFPYKKNTNGIRKRFWPVTWPLFRTRHVWRTQQSWFHYVGCYFNTPDLTIINMSGHGSKYCFQLGKLLQKKGKSYIAMVGGVHFSTEGEAKNYFLNAHHIIVHTNIQKHLMLQVEAYKDLTIEVMPLGIDTEEFVPKKKNNKDIELLFVGRISRIKQIELCIEAVAFLLKNQCKKVHLKVIGPISDSNYFSELKALVAELGIVDCVDFIGMIEHKELVSYFQKADLLLLPSAHESFGMVMVEAMSCGTPVAALKGSGGPDEIIQNGINGILASKEIFFLRILQFLQSDDMKQKLSENARRVVEEKWSLKQTERAMKNSLNKVFA